MQLNSYLVSGARQKNKLHNEHEGQLEAGAGSKACHDMRLLFKKCHCKPVTPRARPAASTTVM